ncbi:MAG: hypothetical protein R3F19_28015 [Verrucomicrobiales bacterium]
MRHRPVMAVLSSGQWGGPACAHVLYLDGGGIMAQLNGTAGGVTALRQAWACALGKLGTTWGARLRSFHPVDEHPRFSACQLAASQGPSEMRSAPPIVTLSL